MDRFKDLENRTETEAISLLKSDICPICLYPAECVAAQGSSFSTDEEVFYECEACGHEFTILISEKFGNEKLYFGV